MVIYGLILKPFVFWLFWKGANWKPKSFSTPLCYKAFQMMLRKPFMDFHIINPIQPSVAFHIETRHLICSANQMTGFYMRCNTGLKWVNWGIPKKRFCLAIVLLFYDCGWRGFLFCTNGPFYFNPSRCSI